MTGVVRISREVRELLGEAVATRIERDGVAAECQLCGVEISSPHGDAAVVVVRRDLDIDRVGYLHESCGPSQVKYTGIARAGVPDDVSYWPVVLPSANGVPRSILLIDFAAGDEYVTTGDIISPVLDGLRQDGWATVEALGRRPPKVEGLVAVYDPEINCGQIVESQGGAFLDNLPTDEQWLTAAMMTRVLTVMVGRFRDMGRKADLRQIQKTVRDGGVIGAEISFSIAPQGLDPRLTTANAVAGHLRTAATSPARRPGQPRDPRCIMAIRAEPLLTTSLSMGPTGLIFPVLTLDLCDPNIERGSAELSRLEALGIMRGADHHGEHLLQNAPKGWAMIVWSSQVLLLNADSDWVFFERLSEAHTPWYLAVRNRRAVGVAIGNNLGESAESDLEVMVRSGEVLAMGVPAVPIDDMPQAAHPLSPGVSRHGG